MTFPISLYESAKLDGCTNLKFIVKILLPLTKSSIGAMAIYTFINAWNMYMWPLLVTGSSNYENGSDWNQYVRQHRFSVSDNDGCWSCHDYHSIYIDFYRRTETVN